MHNITYDNSFTCMIIIMTIIVKLSKIDLAPSRLGHPCPSYTLDLELIQNVLTPHQNPIMNAQVKPAPAGVLA